MSKLRFQREKVGSYCYKQIHINTGGYYYYLKIITAHWMFHIPTAPKNTWAWLFSWYIFVCLVKRTYWPYCRCSSIWLLLHAPATFPCYPFPSIHSKGSMKKLHQCNLHCKIVLKKCTGINFCCTNSYFQCLWVLNI